MQNEFIVINITHFVRYRVYEYNWNEAKLELWSRKVFLQQSKSVMDLIANALLTMLCTPTITAKYLVNIVWSLFMYVFHYVVTKVIY